MRITDPCPSCGNLRDNTVTFTCLRCETAHHEVTCARCGRIYFHRSLDKPRPLNDSGANEQQTLPDKT